MNIGWLLPGFSADEHDTAIPIQHFLVQRMAERHHVRVLTTRYPHTRTPYTFYGAEVTPFGHRQRGGLRRFMLWAEAIAALRKMHRARPFDVLHATWPEPALIAVWAGRLLGVPTVTHFVGGELIGLRDIGYGYQLSPFMRWMTRQALNADCPAVASAYLRGLIPSVKPSLNLDRVAVVPFGVDAERLRPSGRPPIANRLIHVASMNKVKDQQMLLWALALIPEATLDFVGTGDQEAALHALADQLGIAERINWTGNLPYEQLAERYQQAALHVITSRHEGQAMVTLEAAACGVPTVGTRVGVLADDPALGVSVEIGNHEALAEVIRDLLADEPRRAALGVSARQAVEARYTLDHTIRQFEGIYERLTR